MSSATVIDLAVQTMIISAKLCAPILITALVVGFGISLLQSITQIQEATLAFVPKLIAVAVALIVCGQWMISELVTYTQSLWALIPKLVSGG